VHIREKMAVWSCLRSPAVVANIKQLLKTQASLKVTQNGKAPATHKIMTSESLFMLKK
jgi:hypothetical protein